MPIQAPFQFVGGLVKGLVGDNNLTELQTCATDSGAVVAAVEQVVKDLLNHQHLKLITDVKKVIPVLQTTVADCKATSDELADIKAWAMIFTD